MEKITTVQNSWPEWRPHAFDYALLMIVGFIAWTYFQNGLARVPGPVLARFTPMWRLLAVWNEDMPRRSIALHKRYGPIVRVGPNHVSVSSAEALQLVYGFKTAFAKSPIYAVGQPHLDGHPLPNLFSLRDPETHTSLKRTIGSVYTVSSITDLEFHIDKCIDTMISKFKHLTQHGTAILDMSAWLQFFSFDSIGATNFSRNLGFLDSGTDVNHTIEKAEDRMRYFELAGQVPSIENMFTTLKRITSRSKLNPLIEFALKAVGERVDNKHSPEDILTRLLRVHRNNPERLSRTEVTAAVYINLVAGHDVLAITFRAILYYLSRDPRAHQVLLDEIFNAEKNFSTPVKYSEVSDLPYLSAVIFEALRIHPNIGLMLERCVPAGGATLHGITLAGGTIIGLNAWVIHRNEDVFGADAESYKPERWVNCEPAQLKEMHRNLFTFGAGPRGCVGRNLALIQIRKLIVELYRNFHFTLAEPEKKWHIQGGWIAKQTGMDMIVGQRDRNDMTQANETSVSA